MNSGLSSSLEILFSKMENFVTTKTVVGEPVHIGNVIILPLVDVTFGVGAGAGTSNETTAKANESGGGGLGAKITPSAVLVVVDGNVQMINLKNQDGVSKLIDMAPSIINKFNFSNIFSKNKTDVEKEKTDFKFTETHVVEDGEEVVIKTETIAKEVK